MKIFKEQGEEALSHTTAQHERKGSKSPLWVPNTHLVQFYRVSKSLANLLRIWY